MFLRFLYGIAILISINFYGCDSKPKIIVEDTSEVPQNAPVNPNQDAQPSGGGAMGAKMDVHQVKTLDVMQAERYTYLQVSEGNRTFWIAASKMEANKGDVFLYRGGLLKTNFESIEFKRTFDTLYLVSSIINANNHPGSQPSMANNGSGSANASAVSTSIDINAVKGAIKLSELIKNKEKYAGQTVTVAGECVKVNNGIMDRNWIHIHDGTESDGKPLDLTITTKELVPLGSKVALKGVIQINKDFGAGYKYGVIMEDAAVLHGL